MGKTKEREVKPKIWEHIPVRPTTFEEFRRLKRVKVNSPLYKFSDDGFVLELLKIYRIYLKHKEKKEGENENK